MRCYICNEQAGEMVNGDQKLVDCRSCGPYRISNTLIALRNQDIRIFRTTETRVWLQEQRNSGEQIPLLHTRNVLWD